MVRVDEETHARLLELAEAERETIGRLLARAIAAYEEQRFWHKLDDAVARLQANPADWQQELEERRLLDNTVGDGLADDPYPLDGLIRKDARPSKSRAR